MNEVSMTVFSYFDVANSENTKHFKVFRPSKEKTLEDAVKAALQQIEEKKYVTELLEKGILRENIYCYGFAFEGKKVLIGE